MDDQEKKSEEFEVDFNENELCENIEGKNTENDDEKKNKKKLKKWQKVLIIILVVLLVLTGIGAGVLFGVLNKFQGEEIAPEDLNVSDKIEETYGKSEIINVALFGVDTRNKNAFTGRSDSIMIVSVDKDNNTVKVTSILRDSYVAIDGYKNQKITHAYSLGGAPLAIKTLNENFHMNITDYATINFYKLGEAIDVLGGVDLEITDAERVQINNAAKDSKEIPPLKNGQAVVHLNGDQVSNYVRIRYIDSDAKRAERQRKILNAVLAQVRTINPSQYNEILQTMLELCETSLSATEIMSFAPMIKKDLKIETTFVPNATDEPIGGMYEGYWVWRYDLEKASERIHRFIYEGESGAGEEAETVESDRPKQDTAA